MSTPLLPASFADEHRNYPVPWGYSGLGEMVYARTYSRPRWEEGPKESWSDTIVRVVNGAQAINSRLTEDETYRLAQYMLDLKGTVSGRGLWQFGTPLVELVGGGSLLNCSVTPIHDLPALMDMLMLGTGVGFSVERQYVYEMPRVKYLDQAIRHERRFDADLIVSDKREGWSDLLYRILDAYLVTGKGFSWSTIVLRSAGSPLKTFGGTSSGPQVLIDGIAEMLRILESRAGKKLRSIDTFDLACIVGGIVKAGNARRSALLAQGDPDDHLYLKAKNWASGNVPAYRGNVNVSIAADSAAELPASYWKSGWSGDGEIHGLLNLGMARNFGRTGERANDRKVITTNPCLVGDTWVMTTEGPRQILDLLDQPFVAVVDGDDYKSTAFWWSGTKDVVRIRTADGHELRLTPDHKVMTDTGEWVRAGQSLGLKVRLHDHGIRFAAVIPTAVPSSEVVSVEPDGTEDVYDCTVKDVHAFDANGIYVSNCGEVFLEPYETCNLATLYMPNIASYDEFIDISQILYKIQKATALWPHQNPHTQAVQRRNLRLGQSVTGIAQGTDEQLDWLSDAYVNLKRYDEQWSSVIGVKPSIKLTAIQPSGTLSLLPGVTPGVHAAQARHYIRRVRFGADDPLVAVARKRGYVVQPDENIDGTLNHQQQVVDFPAMAPDNAVVMEDMTAVRQLELTARMQAEWADNAVSVTVNYRDEEVGEIKAWIEENYEHRLKSVSFLRHADHGFALPPYETIDRATYESLVAGIDLSVPLNPNDTSNELSFDDCEGGACPVR